MASLSCAFSTVFLLHFKLTESPPNFDRADFAPHPNEYDIEWIDKRWLLRQQTNSSLLPRFMPNSCSRANCKIAWVLYHNTIGVRCLQMCVWSTRTIKKGQCPPPLPPLPRPVPLPPPQGLICFSFNTNTLNCRRDHEHFVRLDEPDTTAAGALLVREAQGPWNHRPRRCRGTTHTRAKL